MDWLHGDYFAWWSITNGEGYAIGMITIIIILVVVVQTVAIILRDMIDTWHDRKELASLPIQKHFHQR